MAESDLLPSDDKLDGLVLLPLTWVENRISICLSSADPSLGSQWLSRNEVEHVGLGLDVM